jgi:hypothetical protein
VLNRDQINEKLEASIAGLRLPAVESLSDAPPIDENAKKRLHDFDAGALSPSDAEDVLKLLSKYQEWRDAYRTVISDAAAATRRPSTQGPA